jgi:hypothetical protein
LPLAAQSQPHSTPQVPPNLAEEAPLDSQENEVNTAEYFKDQKNIGNHSNDFFYFSFKKKEISTQI